MLNPLLAPAAPARNYCSPFFYKNAACGCFQPHFSGLASRKGQVVSIVWARRVFPPVFQPESILRNESPNPTQRSTTAAWQPVPGQMTGLEGIHSFLFPFLGNECQPRLPAALLRAASRKGQVVSIVWARRGKCFTVGRRPEERGSVASCSYLACRYPFWIILFPIPFRDKGMVQING
jgi:hypothetical protein